VIHSPSLESFISWSVLRTRSAVTSAAAGLSHWRGWPSASGRPPRLWSAATWQKALRYQCTTHLCHSALTRQHDAIAIGLERRHPIRMTSFLAPLCQSATHASPPLKMRLANQMILDRALLRRVDSVAVSHSLILGTRLHTDTGGPRLCCSPFRLVHQASR
jgi:hypothetical protein